MAYNHKLPPYGEVMTIGQFREQVEDRSLMDYDGHGYPVFDQMMDRSVLIQPSTVNEIPDDATHIIWFNR